MKILLQLLVLNLVLVSSVLAVPVKRSGKQNPKPHHSGEELPSEVVSPASPDLTATSSQQHTKRSRIDWYALKPAIGAQIGTNISNSTVNSLAPIFPSGPTLGLAAGANLELAINDRFFIQPEVLFIQKGYRFQNSPIDTVYNFSYLELPVFFKAKFDLSPMPLRPYALGGLSAGILMSNSIERTVANLTRTDRDGDLSRLDFNLILGGGAEMDVAHKIAVFANARYALGLRNISNDLGKTVRNNGFEFLFGPKFTL